MKNWKVLMLACAAVVSVAAIADANWQGQVGAASQDPAVLKATMKDLGAADQLAFYRAVNEAITAKAGSATEKAALYVNAERAALEAASVTNKTAMLAEVFATVPPEGLTAVNEDLAKGALAKGGTSDADFASVARGTMNAVVARNATADNSGARSTFAILAFLRASGGSPEGLRDELLAKLDPESRDMAANEWIDPALKGNYDPILGASDAAAAPDLGSVDLLVSGPGDTQARVLGDLRRDVEGVSAPALFGGGDGTLEGEGDIGMSAKPRTIVDKNDSLPGEYIDDDSKTKEIDPTSKRGHSGGTPSSKPVPPVPPHPGPYD